jgi:predicted dienelactone hydrolase
MPPMPPVRTTSVSAACWLAASVPLLLLLTAAAGAPAAAGASPASPVAAAGRFAVAPATAPAPAAAAGAGHPGAGAAATPPASRFAPLPGPFGVEVMDLDWFDQDRRRPVPVRVYFPRRGAGPFPVVVFSSGLGAGRASFEFLDRHLASHGYVTVQVQHVGSDDRIWKPGGDAKDAKETVMKVVRDPQTGISRLLDLVFALDQVVALQATSPVLRGRIDLKSIAVGGHNLGAWTALSAAGLAFLGKDGEESSLPDPRVKAALLFGPPAPQAKQRETMRFEHIRVPCLHVAGALAETQDDPPAAERRFTFDQITGADEVLVILAGSPGSLAIPKPAVAAGGGRPELVDQLKVVATAFLDAYLRRDATARDWLAGGGLATALGKGSRVEARLAHPVAAP